jgi:hypothetical protein
MAEPVLNTGVYGFNNNVIMYSLKDDGTATFGAKGRGQIRIDGNEGMITSGNWSEKPGEEQGMRIDLDNGFLEIKDKGKDRIYLGTGTAEGLNDNYLTVKSVNNNVLINISDKDYYL